MKTESRFRNPDWKRPFGDHRPMVLEPRANSRILALASHNPKLGGDILTKKRARIPLRLVYLEEYATCPNTCRFKLDGTCYTNNTFADRYIVTPLYWERLERECRDLHISHRKFIVKLHGSGDCPDVDYVGRWHDLTQRYMHMYVWISTAWEPESEIGREIKAAQDRLGSRWVVYWSNQYLTKGSTHVFELREIRWRDGWPEPHQIANGQRYYLCPFQIDTMIRGLDPRDPTTRNCAKCRYCPFTGGNVGWLRH